MKHTIQNISRRPITIIRNSGKAIHMAPDYSCDVSDVELMTNKMIKKMLDRRLIRQLEMKKEVKSGNKVIATDVLKKEVKSGGKVISPEDSKKKGKATSKT